MMEFLNPLYLFFRARTKAAVQQGIADGTADAINESLESMQSPELPEPVVISLPGPVDLLPPKQPAKKRRKG